MFFQIDGYNVHLHQLRWSKPSWPFRNGIIKEHKGMAHYVMNTIAWKLYVLREHHFKATIAGTKNSARSI